MKVDPNTAIDVRHENVLCEDGRVLVFQDGVVVVEDIQAAGNALERFCQSLDPNKFFIVALVPDEKDKPLFFRAREVAARCGVHMQAPLETPERCRQIWEQYVLVKQLATAEAEASQEGKDR